jgi:hypothetical protein
MWITLPVGLPVQMGLGDEVSQHGWSFSAIFVFLSIASFLSVWSFQLDICISSESAPFSQHAA